MELIPQAMAQTTEQAPAAPAPAAPAPAAPAPAPDASTPAQTGKAASVQPTTDQQGLQAPSFQELIAQMVPVFVIIAIVYIIVLRPRQRAEKDKLKQLQNVRRGDTLVTSSGLIGKVTRAIDDAEVEVELAPNVRVRMLRTSIIEVRAKGEPVKDQTAAPKS